MEIVGTPVGVTFSGADSVTSLGLDREGNPVVWLDCTGSGCGLVPGESYAVVVVRKGWTESDVDPAPWIGWTYYGTYVFALLLMAGAFYLGYRFFNPRKNGNERKDSR